MFRVSRFVISKFAQSPESVRKRAGCQQENLAVRLGNSRTYCSTCTQEVLGVTRLADTDRDPLLVGQSFTEEFPQIDGRVVDR